MGKNIQIKDVMLFLGMIAIVLLVVFKKPPTPVFEISPTKEIETRVEGKETEIKTFQTRIETDKAVVGQIHDQLAFLKRELADLKSRKDTFQIIQIQDTIISTLTFENEGLRRIVGNQDSIIVAQRYIINSKDTLIAVGKNDIQKFKKQRNLSLILNGILAGVLIWK